MHGTGANFPSLTAASTYVAIPAITIVWYRRRAAGDCRTIVGQATRAQARMTKIRSMRYSKNVVSTLARFRECGPGAIHSARKTASLSIVQMDVFNLIAAEHRLNGGRRLIPCAHHGVDH
jgi:hypothetical protein